MFDPSKGVGSKPAPKKETNTPKGVINKTSETVNVTRPAYTVKKFKNEAGMDRFFKVKHCTQCQSDPPIEPLNLSGFKGTKCSICFEVISYEKSDSK